jgi:hypothetical protein
MASPDDAEFRRLAELYAQAADRNRPELLDRIMAEHAVIEGPGFRLAGRAEIRTIPASLRQRFHATRHVVENQIVTVDGAAAEGETYCTANHLFEQPGAGMQVLVWHIRYQDRFARIGNDWCFTERRLLLDWTEIRSATVAGG